MSLLLKNLSLRLAPFVLHVDVELRARTVALLGPSGAGKTSLLDAIAGLRSIQSGLIQLDEQVFVDTDRGTFVPARRRGIGYVPQDLALFPHLSVRQNLLYGQKSGPKVDEHYDFSHVVEVLELGPVAKRGIEELSGGEKQRVALGRALLSSPRLLLLDEPLGSLDAELKSRVLPLLLRIRDEFRVPMLYVSHDPGEVETLCDEVVRLRSGKVVEHDV